MVPAEEPGSIVVKVVESSRQNAQKMVDVAAQVWATFNFQSFACFLFFSSLEKRRNKLLPVARVHAIFMGLT